MTLPAFIQASRTFVEDAGRGDQKKVALALALGVDPNSPRNKVKPSGGGEVEESGERHELIGGVGGRLRLFFCPLYCPSPPPQLE